ncbi:hypothetical protein QC764_106030 [Podospora pseudoanserina]|uniref:Uncharacterized protein n=1 Tax=Podospora pseudoanserina TaxID=2609844 RepID=A0ABR0IMA0_9PEZI|nr:hypothetical protein QC764_106030 [Podospora pseudoanserina]
MHLFQNPHILLLPQHLHSKKQLQRSRDVEEIGTWGSWLLIVSCPTIQDALQMMEDAKLCLHTTFNFTFLELCGVRKVS